MSTKNQHNVEEILKRLMYFKKFDTYHQLADFIGVENKTLSAWKQRNSQIAVQKISAKCSGEDLNWILNGEKTQPLTIAEQIGEGYGPEVKLVADYLEVKIKTKIPEERLRIVEEIMADIRAKYK